MNLNAKREGLKQRGGQSLPEQEQSLSAQNFSFFAFDGNFIFTNHNFSYAERN
jgi:hypothetical protein